MESRVLPLPAPASRSGSEPYGFDGLAGQVAAEGWQDADLALAFLPPGEHLAAALAALAVALPRATVAGCEAVTQFAGDRLASGGAVHLFRFTAGAGAEAFVVAAQHDADAGVVERTAGHLAGGGAVLLFADGLRCPVDRRLARLRSALAASGAAGPPAVAGGLASQAQPLLGVGARPFAGTEIVAGGCVAVLLSGVRAEIEVVRGWDPASPLYRVSGAEGNVLYEVDGQSAADWFRDFFTLDGVLAPLPETAHRFPLIVEGPDRDRRGLYRSLRAFDEPPGAVTLWGDVAVGDAVRLGMGNEESLVERAADLVAVRQQTAPEAAVLFSCVGRQQVLGGGGEREVAAVSGALGGIPLSGLFSFGEIGPTPAGGPAFYNHTAILALLTEETG